MLPEYPQIGTWFLPQINCLADCGSIKIIEPDTPSIKPMRGVLISIADKGPYVVDGSIRDNGIAMPMSDRLIGGHINTDGSIEVREREGIRSGRLSIPLM